MKKFLLLFFAFCYSLVFSQENDSLSYDFDNDTNNTKEKYIGLNIGTFIKQIMEPDLAVTNFSAFYKVEKSNRMTYQFKINAYTKEKTDIYGFTDSLNNNVSRTYTDNYTKIDLRAGIGLYDKLGYGKIYFSSNFIAGYALLSKKYDDNIIYIEDSVVTGYGGVSEDISKADYITFGLDFAFGYEIDLGEHIMLSLEYNPEFNFYTMLNSEYYIENSTIYNNNFINANFNIFNVNLLYHF